MNWFTATTSLLLTLQLERLIFKKAVNGGLTFSIPFLYVPHEFTAKFQKKLDYLDIMDILDLLDFTKPLIFPACPVSPVCPDSPACHGYPWLFLNFDGESRFPPSMVFLVYICR